MVFFGKQLHCWHFSENTYGRWLELVKVNYRRCISCRRLARKESFWRVVRVHPSHQVQLDQGMGRSAYICPHPSCLKTAQKKNRLGKALKAKVPPDVYETLWQRWQESSPPPATSSAKAPHRESHC